MNTFPTIKSTYHSHYYKQYHSCHHHQQFMESRLQVRRPALYQLEDAQSRHHIHEGSIKLVVGSPWTDMIGRTHQTFSYHSHTYSNIDTVTTEVWASTHTHTQAHTHTHITQAHTQAHITYTQAYITHTGTHHTHGTHRTHTGTHHTHTGTHHAHTQLKNYGSSPEWEVFLVDTEKVF